MFKRCFALVGLVFVLATGVLAQDGKAENTCTQEQWDEYTSLLVKEVEELSDSDDPLFGLFEIDAYIEVLRANCTGGVWSSEDYGENGVVIGPVIFSGTMYQGTLKTDGSASYTINAVQGDCGLPLATILITDLDSDEVEETNELHKFKECVALIEVDGYGGPWSLNIVKLK